MNITTLKNYSDSTLKAYLNGLNIFLEYLSLHQIHEISLKELELFGAILDRLVHNAHQITLKGESVRK